MKLRWLLFPVIALAAAGATAPAQAPSAAASSPSREEGAWEGELLGSQWPIFVTLALRREQSGLAGTLASQGRSLPLARPRWTGDGFEAAIEGAARPVTIAATRQGGNLVGTYGEGGRALTFTLHPIPAYPHPADRIEGWRQDLDALATRFAAFDRSFTPATRASFLAALAGIGRELPALDDAEVTMRIAAAIALADNGHTRLYLLRNRTELRRLPIRIWWFADQLRIVRATPEYRQLLGCRIDAIGGIQARRARDIAGRAFAGNPSWRDYMTTYTLTSPEALHGLGIVRDMETIDLRVSGCAGPPHRQVRPLPLVRSTRSLESWWDLTPLKAPTGQWVQMLEARRSALPLYLRNPDLNYWFERLPAGDILYFNYGRAQDMEAESTAAFGERLLAEISRQRPRAFVLDLRFNTGGDLGVAADLMRRLQEATRGMPRYVVTGRATFSAGISQVASWRQAGDVTVVGEPVGDSMDLWAEGGNIRLPYSGLDAHFANGFHSYSTAPCPVGIPCLDMSSPSLAPDLPVTARWEDYVAGRDPVMTAIAADLTHRR
jgi:hypothetical protein